MRHGPTNPREPELHSVTLNAAPDTARLPRQAEGALGPYLRAVRAHRVLVAVVTLAAILASILWIVVRPPDYEATANLLVNPLQQEEEELRGLPLVRDSGDPTRTIQTAATLIESAQAADRTARELGDGWTIKRVRDAIEVTPEGESDILAVTATADDARVAARLANTFARSALALREEELQRQVEAEIERLQADLATGTDPSGNANARIDELEILASEGDPTLELSETAQEPDSPSGPPAPVIVFLAALAGFTLGSAGALLLEITERRIRDEDEAVGLYPLPVLARIPLLKSSQLHGRQPTGWHMPPAVREAFRTLMIQLGPHPEGRAHVVMVTSASTGDGKTTSAVNLAAAAAASGDPVILLDFDLRKPDVGATLGVHPGTELTGLLQPQTRLRDLLSPAPGLPALSVLSTSVAEGDIALVEALSRRLPELIAEARELCNYVVIDTAPLGEISDALRLVSDVDNIIVVTRPGHTNRGNFEVTRDLLQRTAYTPAGFLIIGDTAPRTSAYYAYGAPSRELFTAPEGGFDPRSLTATRTRERERQSADGTCAGAARAAPEPARHAVRPEGRTATPDSDCVSEKESGGSRRRRS